MKRVFVAAMWLQLTSCSLTSNSDVSQSISVSRSSTESAAYANYVDINLVDKSSRYIRSLDSGPLVSNGLSNKIWHHGAKDCATNTDAVFDVYQQDQTSFILRENKCLSYEATFIYVLLGEQKIVIFDTGSIEVDTAASLYQTIKLLIGEAQMTEKQILVMHSHGHSDHYQGDAQFEGLENVTVVAPSAQAMKHYFGFSHWPLGEAIIDLGGRQLTVIPTPGHQDAAISIYDNQTQWLLSGDTFYPGVIYIKDWQEYKASIARLVSFSTRNEIWAILGSHIEMTDTPKEYYPLGTRYQPNEAALDLSHRSLVKLNIALQASDSATTLVFDEFIVAPMGIVQTTISNVVNWFRQ